MVLFRGECVYIHYFQMPLPSLLFYKTLPESYGANESGVVDIRL